MTSETKSLSTALLKKIQTKKATIGVIGLGYEVYRLLWK